MTGHGASHNGKGGREESARWSSSSMVLLYFLAAVIGVIIAQDSSEFHSDCSMRKVKQEQPRTRPHPAAFN